MANNAVFKTPSALETLVQLKQYCVNALPPSVKAKIKHFAERYQREVIMVGNPLVVNASMLYYFERTSKPQQKRRESDLG